MALNPSVKLGPWTDHDWSLATDGATHLLTVTTTWGTIWKLSLGVVIGLSWPCARGILVRCWAWMIQIVRSTPKDCRDRSEEQPLLHETFAELSNESEVADPDSGNGLQAINTSNLSPVTQQSRSPGNSEHSEQTMQSQFWPDIVLALLLAVGAVLYAFAGGAVGELPTNNTGLSDNGDCGFWELQRNADWRIQDNDDLVQAEKEARASHYAKTCYREEWVDNNSQCELFQTPTISHSMEKVNCPFPCPDPDNCICANGIYNSAVKLDTGTFRVDKLGLNAAHLPLVRLTSTFVPLNIDYGFVEDKSGAGDDFKFEYYLGPINDTAGFRNFTFSMHGLPFNWDVAAYAVSAYESTPSGSEYDAWQPNKELSRDQDTFMTVIFVSSCRILYNGRCDDPVFPANRELFPIDRPVPKYYNSDPRPRVLVAIDEMRVCANDETVCDSPDELPKGISRELRSAFEMARTVFKRTSTYNSLRYRRGSALVAADGISDFESRQLDDEQWIIESEALFRTSLARLQFNARDFAMGDRPQGRYRDAYNNTTPDWARYGNCVPYKFPLPSQYTNIRVGHFAFLLVPVGLLVGSLKASYPKKELPFSGSWLVFDSVLYYIISANYLLGNALWYLFLVAKRKVQGVGMLFFENRA
ncbi:hypothetical protein PG997_011563 [Apiospora hydei]|uniref:Uncharacterized protein n=1 Tax=Apiospora hydei TaxID=1337664 RepID=A0ABR1VMB2_9PEZI